MKNENNIEEIIKNENNIEEIIKNENNIEEIIKSVNANMRLEGMILTEEEKENIRKCLLGEVNFEDMKNKIINKYRRGR